MKERDYPFVPEVSPGRQGLNAWTLLTEDQKGHVETALEDAAQEYHCHRRDLQWRIDKYGAVHVRKTPRIELCH